MFYIRFSRYFYHNIDNWYQSKMTEFCFRKLFEISWWKYFSNVKNECFKNNKWIVIRIKWKVFILIQWNFHRSWCIKICVRRKYRKWSVNKYIIKVNTNVGLCNSKKFRTRVLSITVWRPLVETHVQQHWFIPIICSSFSVLRYEIRHVLKHVQQELIISCNLGMMQV